MTWIYTWWYGEEKKDTVTSIWEYASPWTWIAILFILLIYAVFISHKMLRYLLDLLFGSKEPQQQSFIINSNTAHHHEQQPYQLESAILYKQRPTSIIEVNANDEKTIYYGGRKIYVASTIGRCRHLIHELKQYVIMAKCCLSNSARHKII